MFFFSPDSSSLPSVLPSQHSLFPYLLLEFPKQGGYSIPEGLWSVSTEQLLGESWAPHSITIFALLLKTGHLLCTLLPPGQVTATTPTWQEEPSRSKVFKTVTTWVS